MTSTSSDHRIRVLLLEMPRMLGDLVTGVINTQPDMLVVGALLHLADVTTGVAHLAPDVIVLGRVDAQLPRECAEVLRTSPGMRVLVVEDDGRHGSLWELQPHRQALGEVSPTALVEVIRASSAAAHLRSNV